jgi:hypothetical protein
MDFDRGGLARINRDAAGGGRNIGNGSGPRSNIDGGRSTQTLPTVVASSLTREAAMSVAAAAAPAEHESA